MIVQFSTILSVVQIVNVNFRLVHCVATLDTIWPYLNILLKQQIINFLFPGELKNPTFKQYHAIIWFPFNRNAIVQCCIQWRIQIRGGGGFNSQSLTNACGIYSFLSYKWGPGPFPPLLLLDPPLAIKISSGLL